LFDNLIAAIIYRPITTQKIINMLLAQQKKTLNEKLKENEDNIENYEGASEESTVDNLSIHRKTPVSPNQTLPNKRKCYASKCQLLKATGIIPDTMFCTTGRNMCSGCTIEMHKQAKTAQLEREICLLSVDNHILQPVLSFRSEYTSKTKFRRALSCLPTFNSNSQDDSIFGAARYLANTIGILIQTPSSLIIDQPMTIMEKKQMWRKATFFCRCTTMQRLLILEYVLSGILAST
jgi:hypothetical protein